ncbi:hypothetical protein GUJ93_ZPchr0005g16008 [Zizania palustris]|uniref:Peptidase A1 domain-containing protein n=1 Tax=Zizania palustris TaxID=103762 RepID=A0A8J5S3Y9_ZIZPA|nr:hypothetical protein GUJ93_ZPchr0005g16008 [Zizania palustris]
MMTPLHMVAILIVVLLVIISSIESVVANGIFQVQRKFPSPRETIAKHSLGWSHAHDRNHHARVLAATDIPLGGLGFINYSGLYYAKIRIGTPPQRYFVQVDTGSAIFWINCFNLTLYDPKESSTADWVKCKNEFCHGLYGKVLPGCTIGSPCPYKITYDDDGSTLGMFVSVLVQYDQVTGNGQTQPANTSIVFGCGYQQGRSLNTSNGAIDGIIGFAKPNTTMLSQLAATGKTKKIFAHCLDTTKGETLFSAPVLIPHPVTMSDTFYMDDAKQMLKEILASTTDLQKCMVAQEDKLATMSDEVASLKVDQ